jgi:molybdopterin-guanine dinucleotide biosynthesis protein A
MGRPKAWLPWRGQPMVAHVVSRLREVVQDVVVVTSQELDLPPVDARVVRDRRRGLGPLAGICEGLAHVEGELAFVTGTDAPFLTPRFVATLLGVGGPAAPRTAGAVQTLAAVYPRCGADRARALLAAGERRPLTLLEAVGYRSLPEAELADPEALRGFNTPEAYLDAVREDQGPCQATLEFVGRARLQAGCASLAVPVGTLADVLAHAPSGLALCREGRVTRPYLVSLGGRDFVRDARIPVGPGERVIVLDAAAGG